MRIYFIKTAMRGVSPMIWRRLRIPGNTSLAQLHHIIQIANHWDDEYLHQFHIHGKDYGISYLGGILFSDNACTVFLDDFSFDVGDKFTYEYNFFEPWMVDIRVENIQETESQQVAYCVKGKGMPGVTKYDEIELTSNLLKAFVSMDETTPINDIRPLVNAFNEAKFNRHPINHRLKTELIGPDIIAF